MKYFYGIKFTNFVHLDCESGHDKEFPVTVTIKLTCFVIKIVLNDAYS